jgi:hypothetical protein
MLNVTDGRTRSGSALCAWFVEMPESEAALMAGGIMAKVKRRQTTRGAKS